MCELFYGFKRKTFFPSPKSKSQYNDITHGDRACIGQDHKNSNLLHHFFETCAYNTPGATAIICGELTLTYRELEKKANQLASNICSLINKEERLCAIYLERSELPIISMLAALKAGLGYVPIDPDYPRERVLDILNDSGVGLLISEQSLWSNIDSSYHKHIILLDAEGELISRQPEGRIELDRKIEANDLSYIIYTSGSSGRPKGVMIEHQSVVNYVVAINELYKVNQHDRVYQGFSHAFDAAIEEIWVTLCFGATLVIGTGDIVRSAHDVARLINEWKVTVFSTIPTFLSMMEDDLLSVRLLILGGEECLTELVNRWSTKTRQFFNTYGPTETAVVATATECFPNQPVTIGKALRGYETLVLDEKLRRVPPGELGELCIGSISLARGYLNRPNLTQEKFIANPFLGDGSSSPRLYRTGDLVSLTSEGNLKFHGRIDSQIKIRGHRVELSEIEEVMLENSDVKNAVVNVVKVDGVQKIAAYMVPQVTPKEVDRQAIFLNLRLKLPTYMMPSFLDCLRVFPVLPSGKVDRKTLPPPIEHLISSERKIVAANTEAEKMLVRICAELVGNPEISIKDDFFVDLGGHSLLAARLVSVLRTELNSNLVSIRHVYSYPILRDLATFIANIKTSSSKMQSQDYSKPNAREVIKSVPIFERWAVYLLQGMTIAASFSLISILGTCILILLTSTITGAFPVSHDYFPISTGVTLIGLLAFFGWPLMLGLSILAKWLIIGRYKPGSYPLWGFYYFRCWLVSYIQSASGVAAFSGTPIMNLYYRLMGARLGRNCDISTAICSAFDLVSIGDESSIGAETHILGTRVENGMLHLGRIAIGRRCFVGVHSNLGLNTEMEDDARLDDMSMLPDGMVIKKRESYRGSPAKPGSVSVPEAQPKSQKRRPVLFGFLHYIFLLGTGGFLLIVSLPSLALVAGSYINFGITAGLLAVFTGIPLSIILFCSAVVVAKKILLRKVKPGVYPQESWFYLRKCYIDRLLNISRTALSIYATLYLPPWLRLLGARLGKQVEVSTVTNISPDLLECGNGCFLADGVIVGSERTFRGNFEISINRIGSRSFIGNSAMIPVDSNVGSDCLIGALSISPQSGAPNGSKLLGSPPFELPRRQEVEQFDDSQIYSPPKKLYVERLFMDAFRILIPGWIAAMAFLLNVMYVVYAYWNLPILETFLYGIPISMGLFFATFLCVVAVKKVLMGSYEPVIKPLWCRYVWFNEIVNGTYETIGAIFLKPFLGTPMIRWFLRMIGCRIGRYTYIGTTLFSEFDLVEVGQYCALNVGATIQTHLFEDRIMKSSNLKVHDMSTVGNMAVLLYDTEMKEGSTLGPLSLLMKGETLPKFTKWHGIPTDSYESVPSKTCREFDSPTTLHTVVSITDNKQKNGVSGQESFVMKERIVERNSMRRKNSTQERKSWVPAPILQEQSQEAKLSVAKKGKLIKEFSLKTAYLTIGQGRENDVHLPDREVSRFHARISDAPNGHRLEDLTSANGTYVNGKRITEYTLEMDDVIKIHDYQLSYKTQTNIGSQQEITRKSRIPALPRQRQGHEAKLIVAKKGKMPKEFSLNGACFSIGRAQVNDIHLPERGISRVHARILWDTDGHRLEDLTSANGTYVNGKRIREHILKIGDMIKIKDYQISYERQGQRRPEGLRLPR